MQRLASGSGTWVGIGRSRERMIRISPSQFWMDQPRAALIIILEPTFRIIRRIVSLKTIGRSVNRQLIRRTATSTDGRDRCYPDGSSIGSCQQSLIEQWRILVNV